MKEEINIVIWTTAKRKYNNRENETFFNNYKFETLYLWKNEGCVEVFLQIIAFIFSFIIHLWNIFTILPWIIFLIIYNWV